MYVKLFGGPHDGRQENVTEGCDTLQLRHLVSFCPDFEPTLEPGSPCPMPKMILHTYRRVKDTPNYFVYEGENNVD